MTIDIQVGFPGGKRVAARFGGHTVLTDQAVAHGGEGSAPEPMDLFFASLATCVGVYALGFGQARELDTKGLGVRLRAERDEAARRYRAIEIEVRLPHGFPERYRDAIARTVDLCTVKKLVLDPPAFEVTLTGGGAAAARQ